MRLAASGLWRPILALLVLALAGFLLHRAVGRYEAGEVVASVLSIPGERLGMAALFAAASYVCLTGFDALAVRYAGHGIPYRYVAKTSFTSLSLGHNIGFAALSSGAIRYRLYSRYGLSFADVAKVIVFCGLTVALGLMVLGGAALCWRPGLAAEMMGVGRSFALAIGVLCLAAAPAYLLFCTLRRRPVRIRKYRVDLPSPRQALGQLIVGPLNFALVAACLHQALAGTAEVAYAGVATVYVLANVATVISHVPGGVGVIEGVVLTLIPGADVVGALVVFRVVYFLVPLVLGSTVLAFEELFGRHRKRPAPR